MKNNVVQPPWYKQAWPWFLIALPLSAVIAGFVTLWLAHASFDGMVVDDYIKDGKAVKPSYERRQQALKLGLSANVMISGQNLVLTLQSTEKEYPHALFLSVIHPTQPARDQIVSLVGNDGQYRATIQPLVAAQWQFRLENESRTWRLNGTAHLPTENRFSINP